MKEFDNDTLLIPESAIIADRKKHNIEDLYHQKIISNIDPITSTELSNLKITPSKVLISPWLKENRATMVYAASGVGKTFFALNCAYALASGRPFLKFETIQVDSILYIDGEMDAEELQERWRMISKNEHYDSVKFYTPCLFPDNLTPFISTKEGQHFYNEKIKKFNPKVIIFDNLSMLTDLKDDNKSNEWNPVIRWFIQLKNQGVSIIAIHHTNKGKKDFRSSEKIGDHLNSILHLEQINDDSQVHTARFKVKYTKKRGFYGKDAEEFEAWLDEQGNWHTSDITTNIRLKIIDGHKLGMSPNDLAKDLDISPRTVYRHLDDAETAGLIKKRPHGNKK